MAGNEEGTTSIKNKKPSLTQLKTGSREAHKYRQVRANRER